MSDTIDLETAVYRIEPPPGLAIDGRRILTRAAADVRAYLGATHFVGHSRDGFLLEAADGDRALVVVDYDANDDGRARRLSIDLDRPFRDRASWLAWLGLDVEGEEIVVGERRFVFGVQPYTNGHGFYFERRHGLSKAQVDAVIAMQRGERTGGEA